MINRYNIIETVIEEKDFIFVQKLIKKYRKRDIIITENEVKQLCENGALIIWGEVYKYAIVLSLAWYFKIFTPTFWIMNIFSSLRGLAGGVHMSTFNKCFAVMISVFLLLGYLVSHIHISPLFMVIGYVLSFIFAFRYAPQERPDKSDKDCDNGNKRKYMVMVYIVISLIISLMLYQSRELISSSIFIGVFLEMFTVTPIGTRFFKWIDGRSND